MSKIPSISPLTVTNLISKQADEIEDICSDGDTESSLSTIKLGGKVNSKNGDKESGKEDEKTADERPGLLRKKSGELIKSSLKLSGLSRSMSASQIGNKSVRFATRLANVKMFDGQQSPSTVSTAENTPMSSPRALDDFNSKGYFDLKWEDDEVSDITSDTSSDDELHFQRPATYRIAQLDFRPPRNIFDKQDMPCYLQSIKLSPEKTALVGLIMVKNLAFEKRLSIKLTFNDWRSILIINNISYSKSFSSINFDQFKFVIPLEHMPKQLNLQFVIKYEVGGNNYWDNNSMKNYHISLQPFETVSDTKPHNSSFKNTVPQFDELVTKLINFRKADYALEGDLMDSHNDEYVYSKKPFSTRAKSDFHNRYNINDNLSEPRSNPHEPRSDPFISSTPTINIEPPSNASPSSLGDAATSRPPLKVSYSTSDISNIKPKYSKSYKSKQSLSQENDNTNFNSQFYTNLLQSYCFYNGDKSVSTPSSNSSSTPHFNSTNTISHASTASTLQSYSDSIYI
mmetsp:Transcript_8042/g.7984  ORF Transcript_8042/g.7984 Transcript_8042/m.7984 type:complete len:513 (+) Transcript_8042:106-1644(+)